MNTKPTPEDLKATLLVGVPIFVLIDPLAGEPLYIEVGEDAEDLSTLREVAWQSKIIPIELDYKIELSPDKHPYLVLLDADNYEALLASTLELAQDERQVSQAGGLLATGSAPHRIGGWIQTVMPPEQLSSQLSEMMRVNTRVNTSLTYQRLADRRVLDWFSEVIGQDRLSQVLNNIQSWHYLDVHGDIKKINKTQKPARQIRLNSKEWTLFMMGASVHQTIARWLGEVQRSALRMNDSNNNTTVAIPSPKENIYKRAVEALNNAQLAKKRWPTRFQEPEDQVAWAVLHLLYGSFEQNKAALDLLNVATQGEMEVEGVNAICHQLNSLIQRTTS